MPYSLEIRKTYKYVGTYQHLDEWEEIGTYTKLGSTVIYEDDEGFDSSITTVNIVEVHPTAGKPQNIRDIKQALMDSHSSNGCHHEYDCCGCRSYSAIDATRLYAYGKPTNRWAITICSTANY